MYGRARVQELYLASAMIDDEKNVVQSVPTISQ